MHEIERHRIILSAVAGPAGRDRGRARRADRRVRGDDPARHRARCTSRSGCAGCAAAPKRSHPPQIRRPRRPALRGQRDASTSPRSAPSRARRSSSARTASRSSSTAAPPPSRWCTTSPTAGMQILTNSFPIAEHLLQHSKNTVTAARRRDLSRAEHHPVALRQRRDAQFLCAAHVHGRAGARPARR